MATVGSPRIRRPALLLLLLLLAASVSSLPPPISASASASAAANKRQTYIAYLGDHSGSDGETTTEEKIREHHHSFLLSVLESEEEARGALVHSYNKAINGFAAVLSKEEADRLSEMEEVISVFPSRRFSLHTTRSWEFMKDLEGLVGPERDLLPSMGKHGEDIIIGVVDSGIWPESESFSDRGMGPIPSKWRGICQEGDAFNSSHCNQKIIGARYYIEDYERHVGPLNTTYAYRSPRDHDGHGTHTASTAAGRGVRHASALGGFASGSATGGAPLARIAVYKVCWPTDGPNPNAENSCFEADLLRAIDQAIYDGVDVLSISIGANLALANYTTDGIALGALHAARRDVVVACSGGNSGPQPSSVVNLAPWIITVGASSTDRSFPAPVLLGNGKKVKGQTLTLHHLRDDKRKMYPLIYAGDAEVAGVVQHPGQCLPDTLSPTKVKGKIVLCLRGFGLRVEKGAEVARAGGAGMILGNSATNGKELVVDSHVLPATGVAFDDATALLAYINSTAKPTARLVHAKTAIGVKPSPFMAGFTSRGPNPIDPNLIKPDITAPGLNILAAWTPVVGPTKLTSDTRVVKYNVYSGTSMACPHVSGVAALLKSIHPTWSSAAIRSAMMTTAFPGNNLGGQIDTAFGKPAGPFDMGSGHIMPANAADPGLVYDATYADYITYGCSSIKHQYDRSITCPEKPSPSYNLNHPSVAVGGLRGTVRVKRTVTNVGEGRASYNVSISPPPGVSASISPSVLSFDSYGEKRTFCITLKADGSEDLTDGGYSFGSYVWMDGVHSVRSPIAVSIAKGN